MLTSEITGQTLHGYELHEKIGEGGFGAVYRARELAVNRDVAIKVILAEHASEPEFMRRFETEALLVAQLEHPHIVPLYSYWHDDQGAFLVMRYVRGGSLRERIRKQGLSIAETTRILDQVTAALEVAHQAGVVHRDLKPDNILLDERDNAYLTDFGIARQLTDDAHITLEDTIVGTFAYLAPEQIQNQPLSPQTDIYALGVMLYEMLTGTHPFAGTPPMMLLMKHLQEPLPALNTRREDLPSEYDTVIQQATAKNPLDRYRSALEVIEAFRSVGSIPTQNSAASLSTSKLMAVSIPRKFPTTAEARNRYNMLQNVRKFWVEGVLNNSLYGMTLIELGMKQQSRRIDHAWDMVLRTSSRADETRLTDKTILTVFDRLNGKLLILGDPGSGKTTLLLELARDLLDRAETDEAHPIPVIFNLSSWSANSKPLTGWLIDELISKYQVPAKVASDWVESDALLLLLDGLDEVVPERRDACVAAINAYRARRGFVDVVVCSRIADYDALTTRLKLNGAVVIQPLDDEQIDDYLSSLGLNKGDLRTRLMQDEMIHELYRSPLMFNIAILAWENTHLPEIPEGISDTGWRNQLFKIYVNMMLERRTVTARYTQDRILYLITRLARYLKEKGQAVFLIENLQPDLLPTRYNQIYRLWFTLILSLTQALFWGLPHYFMAEVVPSGAPALTRGILWGVAGGSWGFILGTGLFRWRFSAVLAGLVFGIASSAEAVSGTGTSELLIQVMSAVLLYTIVFAVIEFVLHRTIPVQDQIRSMELLHFQRSTIHPLLYAAGFSGGLLTAILHSIIYSDPSITLTNRLAGMILGAAVSGLVVIYIASFVGGEVRKTVRPNEGIHQTLINAIKMGFLVTVGLSISLLATTLPVSSLKVSLVQIIVTAIPFGFTGLLTYGGYYVLQHIVLRAMLSLFYGIPLNLVHALDDMVAMAFMRRVGGSYIFIHRYLLEYFARLDTPEH